MPRQASTLRLRIYKDDIDSARHANEIVQQHGFHPAKFGHKPSGEDPFEFSYQPYENSKENQLIIDDVVEELDEFQHDMDVWSEKNRNDERGHTASWKTVLYVAPDRSVGRQTTEIKWEEYGGLPTEVEDGINTTVNRGVAAEKLRNVGLPGRGKVLEERISAILTMYSHLLDHPGDRIAKTDLLALIEPDEVGYKSMELFWDKCIEANKSQGRDTNTLVKLPDVEHCDDGKYRISCSSE